MKQFKKFSLKTFDSKGYQLTPIEFKDVAPFEVKRSYYITKFQPNAFTGEHCHKIEEEIFIQEQGSSVAVIDKGNGKEEITLQTGDVIYTPNYVWHGFKNPSSDCVVLALSSTNYNASREDYVESYEEYLTFRDEKLK